MDTPVTVFDLFFTSLTGPLGIRHGALDTVNLFSLGLARWLPVAALAPFLGGKLAIAPVRMGFGFLLSLLFLPQLSAAAPVPLPYSTVFWWGLLLKEMALGVIIGFAAGLPFWAAEMGGQFVDTARGTTVANLLVPQTKMQSSILGDFYFQLFVVLFMLSGAHRLFLEAALDSYRLMPPLAPGLALGTTAFDFVVLTAEMFVVAVRIIAPALVVVILLDVVLGIANRMAPQLDVFFMSLSLKSALSALVIGLSIYGLASVGEDTFRRHYQWLVTTTERLAVETEAAHPRGEAHP